MEAANVGTALPGSPQIRPPRGPGPTIQLRGGPEAADASLESAEQCETGRGPLSASLALVASPPDAAPE
eukprot:5702624-Alexandrium_andersonii.AAC.1